MYTLKLNKGVYLSMKQGKIFSHKVTSLAQAVITYLLVRKCSQAKAYSYETKWGSEFCAYETAFSQHIFIKPRSSPILSLNNFVQVINTFFLRFTKHKVCLCVFVCV